MPLYIIGAVIVLAIVAYLGYEAYLIAIAVYDFIDGSLDRTADLLIDWSLLIGGGSLVFLMSRWARRNAPPRRITEMRTLRAPAPARKDNVILLPDLRSVPMPRVKTRKVK
jgi:ABC-type Fe3+ transport system permease subunit